MSKQNFNVLGRILWCYFKEEVDPRILLSIEMLYTGFGCMLFWPLSLALLSIKRCQQQFFTDASEFPEQNVRSSMYRLSRVQCC